MLCRCVGGSGGRVGAWHMAGGQRVRERLCVWKGPGKASVQNCSLSLLTLKKQKSQLFYQQNEFIWEDQRNCNLGHANCGEPQANPRRQMGGQPSAGIRRKLGRLWRLFISCRWWEAYCCWVRRESFFLLGSVSRGEWCVRESSPSELPDFNLNFFLLVLWRYNWHTALYKFKVYSTMIWPYTHEMITTISTVNIYHLIQIQH